VFSLEQVSWKDVKTISIGYWLWRKCKREKIKCNLYL